MEVLKNYINGAWVNSASIETLDVLNPANQDVLAKVPYGADTAKDINVATESAFDAYK